MRVNRFVHCEGLDMALTNETRSEIHVLVHGGFKDAERIVEILTEEMYEPGELDEAEVEAFVAQSFAALEQSKAHWPAVTDCDRLVQAFAQMDMQGVLCMLNAGYTQSEGFEGVQQALRERDDADGFIGYCFFHGQDLERVLGGGGLRLAFGSLDAKLESTLGLEVGQRVVRALAAAGLHTQWDGTFQQRISIPVFDWKYR
jgi:hypothetical protein